MNIPPSKTIACIVGARPNFMKITPIIEELRCEPRFRPALIHTGQHFSPEMSDIFFAILECRSRTNTLP